MIDPELSLDDLPPTTHEGWRAQVERDLRGAPFERLITRTLAGLSVEPLHDRRSWPPDRPACGAATLAPFARGLHDAERVTAGWDLRQVRGEATAEALAAAAGEDAEGGASSLLLRLDRATRLPLSPPGPGPADGLVALGRADLEAALAPIALDATPIALDAGAAAPLVAAALLAVADARGIPRASLRGALGLDPLGALIRDGWLPTDVEAALAELGALARWARAATPDVVPVTVDVGPYHDAGATEIQTLAWGIATGLTYLRAMIAAGLTVDEAAPRILFRSRLGGELLMGVAELRAARALWARVVEVAGGGPEARRMRQHAELGARSLTRRDPHVNALRNTVALFAGAIGGAGVLTSVPFDAAFGASPSPLARRLARTTSLVLRDEASLHRVVDPGGGSWSLERLTADLAEAAWAELQAVEAAGGFPAALAAGRVDASLAALGAKRRERVARRADAIIGVSAFPDLGEAPWPHTPTPRAESLADARARGGLADGAAPAPEALRPDAVGAGMEALIAAAAEDASFAALARARWGRGTPAAREPLPSARLAEPFEAMRDRSDAHLARAGARPAVILATFGPLREHHARAGWTRALFEAGGVAVVTGEACDTPEGAAAAVAAAGGPTTAILCAADARYADGGPAAAAALRAAGVDRLLLAGRPGDAEAALRAAGVASFVFAGADVVALLETELAHLGVPR